MGMRMGDLDRWARAHHGVISMEASGLTRSSWYRAIRSGQLDQLHPGVARLHGTADTAEQRIAAAVLAVGMPALASHRSAARLWGIERPTGDPVDVIVAGRRRLPALRGVVIHRPKDLERLSPPQRRSNIVCTNILRTLLDLGAVDRAAVPDAVGHATPISSERDGSSCASPTGRSPFTRNRPQTASPQPSPGGVEL
jgi:hypothetical protein